MSDDYQLRKDIDSLIHKLWDTQSGELKVLTVKDFQNYMKIFGSQYYDQSDIDITNNQLDRKIDNVDEKAEGIDGNVSDVKNKMGYSYIPSGSTLQGQLNTHTGRIDGVDESITSLQKDTFPFTTTLTDKTMIYQGLPSIETVNHIDEYFGGLVANLKYAYNNNTAYELVNEEWVEMESWTYEPLNTLGITTTIPSGRLDGSEPYRHMFSTQNDKYYEVYYDPQYEGLLGYYGEWRELTERPDYFGQTQFYSNLVDEFATQKEITETNEVISGMLMFQIKVVDPNQSQSYNGFINNAQVGSSVIIVVMATIGNKVISSLPTSEIEMEVIDGDNNTSTLTYSSKDNMYYFYNYTLSTAGLHTFRIDNFETTLMVTNDTGWIDMTLATNFDHYDSANHLQYRCRDKLVEIRGQAKPTVAQTPSSYTSPIVVASLPRTYAPPRTLSSIQQGTDMNRFVAYMDKYGQLSFARYGITSGSTSISANTWLNFYFTYMID